MVGEFARDAHVRLYLTCEGVDKEGCHKLHLSVTEKSGRICLFNENFGLSLFNLSIRGAGGGEKFGPIVLSVTNAIQADQRVVMVI